MIAEFGRLALRLLASLVMLAAIAAVSFGSSEPCLDEEALKDMGYQSVWARAEAVRLTAGEYHAPIGPESGSESETETFVSLTEQIAFGALTGASHESGVGSDETGGSDRVGHRSTGSLVKEGLRHRR